MSVSYTHLDVYKRQDQFVPEADLLSLFEAYVVSYAPAGAQWLIDTPIYATTFLASISTVWIPTLVWIVIAVCLLRVFLAPVELQHDADDELIGLLRQHGACLLYTSRCV